MHVLQVIGEFLRHVFSWTVGLALLAFLLLLGFCSMAGDIVQEKETNRRAACRYVDHLDVLFGGRVLRIPAGASTSINFRDGNNPRGEYSTSFAQRQEAGLKKADWPVGFCLDAAPNSAPREAWRLRFSFDDADRMAQKANVSLSENSFLFVGVGAPNASRFPVPAITAGAPAKFMQVETQPDRVLTWFVTRGVLPDGFRIWAGCSLTYLEATWACETTIHDLTLNMTYQTRPPWIETDGLDGRSVPDSFVEVALGLRRLVGVLEAEAAN